MHKCSFIQNKFGWLKITKSKKFIWQHLFTLSAENIEKFLFDWITFSFRYRMFRTAILIIINWYFVGLFIKFNFRSKFRMIIRHFILSLICILYIISCEGRPGEASLYTEFDKITLLNKTNIKVTSFKPFKNIWLWRLSIFSWLLVVLNFLLAVCSS